MAIRVVSKVLAGIEDLLLGSGTATQTRDSGSVVITGIGGATLPFDNDPLFTIKDAIGSKFAGELGRLTIPNSNLGKGVTAPAQVILGNYTGWEYDINDDSVLTLDLPADLDTNNDIQIHLEWFINEAYATANAQVQWQLDWSLSPVDGSEAIDAPTDSGTLTSGDVNINAIAKSINNITTMVIPAANIGLEDILGLTLTRIALSGAGTDPTAKPTLLAVHIEYTLA